MQGDVARKAVWVASAAGLAVMAGVVVLLSPGAIAWGSMHVNAAWGVWALLVAAALAVLYDRSNSPARLFAGLSLIVAGIPLLISQALAQPFFCFAFVATAVYVGSRSQGRLLAATGLVIGIMPLQLGFVPLVPGVSSRLPSMTTAEAGIYVLFAVWAFSRMLRSQEAPFPPRHAWWLLGFVVGGVVASLLASASLTSDTWVFVRVACVAPLLLYVLITELATSEDDIRLLAGWILGAGLATGVYLILARGLGTWAASSLVGGGRLEGMVTFLGLTIGVTSNTMCAYFGVLLLVALSLWMWADTSRLTRLAAVCMPVYALCILLLATRMVWLALVPCSILVMLLGRRGSKSMPAGRVFLLLTGVFALGVAVASGWPGGEAIIGRQRTLTSLSALLGSETVRYRVESWPVLWRLWLSHPFGTGYFYLIPMYLVGQLRMSIHSLYFLVLLSTGFIGMICFMGFQISILIDGCRCAMGKTALGRAVGAAGAGAVVFVLLNGLSGTLLPRPHLNLPITALLAVAASARTLQINEQGFDVPRRWLWVPRSMRSGVSHAPVGTRVGGAASSREVE